MILAITQKREKPPALYAFLSFMILRSLDDVHTAVDSLKEKDAHELVGEGHF